MRELFLSGSPLRALHCRVCYFAIVIVIFMIWTTPAALASAPFTHETIDAGSSEDIGRSPSLANVFGRLKVAHYSGTGGALHFTQHISSQGWVDEVVDDGNGDDVGLWPSMAIGPSYNPYISYYDATNRRLKYAKRLTDSWFILFVDVIGIGGGGSSIAVDGTHTPHIVYDGGSGAGLKYGVLAGTNWITETVYNDEAVGRVSIDLDSLGQPHVSFRTVTSQNLMHAVKSGGVWTITPVTGAGNVGSANRIRIDSSDEPRIVFTDLTANTLRYAVRSGAVWSTGTVVDAHGPHGSLDFILDDLDRPHVTYTYGANGQVHYSWRDGSIWRSEYVDSEGASPSIALDGGGTPDLMYYDTRTTALKYAMSATNTWIRSFVIGEGDVGADVDLALDSTGGLNAIYQITESNTLVYSEFGGGSWNDRIINDATGSVEGSKASLVVDSSDKARIAFRKDPVDAVGGDLYYAEQINWDWNFALVDLVPGGAASTSIALDGNERPHIAFYNRSAQQLEYAFYDGSSWSTAVVDASPEVGDRCALTIDFWGNSHVGYRDYANEVIRYAKRTGGVWAFEVLPDTGYMNSTTDPPCAIEVDSAGVVHLAYVLGGDVWVASRVSGNWSATLLTASEWPKYALDLALDANRRPHIGFYDDRDDKIVYGVETDIGWRLEDIATTVTLDRPGLSILLDSDQNPNIAYMNMTQGDLKLAHRLESPDLRVSAGGALSSRSFVAGERAVLSATTVFNDGNVNVAASFSCGYYLSRNILLGPPNDYLDEVVVAGLSGYGATTLPPRSLQIPPGTQGGEYYLGILVDENDVVYESSESNNVEATSIDVFPPIWTDVTNSALADPGNITGIAWGDYDNDGDFDLYRTESIQPNVLYRNDAGAFVEATPPILADAGSSRGASWADYDNDGDDDLLLLKASASDRLFRNDGGGNFSDVTPIALADPSANSVASAWGDYDNDGDLDVYVTRANKANLLLRNDGDGTWSDASASPLNDASYSMGAAWADYDDDGDLDLYLVNQIGANRLFRNEGGGAFADATSYPLDDAGAGRGAAWGDYDNDGDLDLYLVNYGSSNRLFRNDGAETFTRVAAIPTADVEAGGGAAWSDYDNDGDLDLYLTRGTVGNRLFRNEGGDVFVDAAPREVDGSAQTNDSAWADYNGDGLMDLGLANTSATQLLRNNLSNGNHWLHLDLQGTISNADGFGAKVRVVTGVTSQLRVCGGEAGYLSQGSATVEFGLGTAAVVNMIEIRWPSGIVQTLMNVPADQRIEVIEPVQDWIVDLQGAVGATPSTRGVVWADVDGDGDDDLYEVNGNYEPNRLLDNVGPGFLVDVTLPPLDDANEGYAATWGDMDNDGDPDLFISHSAQGNRLLRNDGPGSFVDVTAPPLDTIRQTFGVSWVDVDNDGLLDIHLVNGNAVDELYRNLGGGSFIELASPTLADAGAGWSAAWSDYDDDGDMDVYLLRQLGQANRLLRNEGNLVFVEDAQPILMDTETGATGAWGDYDDDGDMDLYLANTGTADHLFRNDAGIFTDVTVAPLGYSGRSQSASWVDTDNDGDLDLHLTTDDSGSLLYRNEGGGVFTDVTPPQMAQPIQAGGAAWADVDADGDLDVVISSIVSPDVLLRNESSGNNHWLHVRLHGVVSNSLAVGARVTLTVAGATRTREMVAGEGLRTQGSRALEFGLGAAELVDQIVVRWPSGQTQTVVDVSADQVIDIVESPWSDITSDLIGGNEWTRSVSWADYDGDGLADLYVCNYMANNKILHNEGGGIFSDATMYAPGPYTDETLHAAWGDMDNDGDPDLFISNSAGTFLPWSEDNMLLENQFGSNFVGVTDVLMTWNPLTVSQSSDVDWLDYDADGDLDLFMVAERGTNRMLRNDGGYVWTLDTPTALAITVNGPEAAWGDYDGDGDLDVYLLKGKGTSNKLFRNDGAGVFTDVTTPPTGIISGNTVAACWGDYDNDLDLDLYVVLFFEPNRLLRNDGGIFTNMPTGPQADAGQGNGAAWGDYDNDGKLDLYIANLAGDDRLLHNEGAGVFTDDLSAIQLTQRFSTYGAAWADCDNDGDLDLYVAGEQRNQLWLNQRRGNAHWLQLELVGTTSNRDAVGARVRIVADGVSQIRERSDDAGGLSKNWPILHFGLGSSAMVDSIIIQWPSGHVDVGVGALADQRITATEGGVITAVPEVTPRRFTVLPPAPNPFNPSTRIRFELPSQQTVQLEVFDVAGRRVRVLRAGEVMGAGDHAVEWRARDDSGSEVASGVYYYRLSAGPYHATGRMVLLK